MGSEHSRGSPGAPDEPEADQVKTEGDLGEQPARAPSSDTANEAAEVHPDEGSASQTAPQQEEASRFSPPAEEPRPQERQEDSQEGGQPPSLSQGTSLDKGHPTTEQTCESDIVEPRVEHSSEKANYTTPEIPQEAAGQPEAEPGVLLLSSEGSSVDPELQATAENLRCLAESPVQRRSGEVSPCPPTEKEHVLEECDCDNASFEILSEAHPERATSETGEGHSDKTAALVTIAETQAGQNKGHCAVDARITEGGEGQTASETPEEADRESPLAQRALDPLEKPLASSAVEPADTNADMKSIHGIQNDGGCLTTEAVSSGNEHPATATVHDPEVEPLPDCLAEPSSKAPLGSDEAKELSLVKETDKTRSGPEAIEMVEAQVCKLDEHPQAVHVSCTEGTLAPVAQETQPVATADVNAQLQGSSGAQKDSKEGPAHVQKQEARFSKTFYFCCRQCSDCDGDGEANAEQ